MKILLLFTCITLSFNTSNAQTELLTNGNFETGSLSDWAISSVNGIDEGPNSCTENWRAQADSFDICTVVPDVAPTDGVFGAFTSFDSNAANTQWILEQTVSLPVEALTSASVSFDFAAEFDFSLGDPITIDRELSLDLYDTGGTLIGNVFNDGFSVPGALSISYSQNVNILTLLEGLEGTDVVLRITALIPESQTGPSKAVIDNISFLVDQTLEVDNNTLNSQLAIFPNPSNGDFTLEYFGLEPLTNVYVFDANGRLVESIPVSGIRNIIEIKTNLITGLYFIEIETARSRATKKLIVK